MKAIVTVVIREIEKRQPKQLGRDILERQSTDMYSRHKSILIEDINTTFEAGEKALGILKEKGLSGRISRVEMI